MLPSPTLMQHWRPIAGGFATLFSAIGIGRFGYPPFIPALVTQGWMSAAEATLGGATNLLAYCIGAISAQWAASRLGLGRAVGFSLFAMAASFVFSAFPQPYGVFLLWRFVSGLTGAWLLILVPMRVMSVVPPAMRGTANGIAFAGIGAGFLLSGQIVPLMAERSLMLAWLVTGLALLGAAVAAIAFLPRHGASPPPSTTPVPAGRWWRQPAFIGLMLAYALAAAGYSPEALVFVDYVARVLGHGLPLGGMLWSLTGVMAAASPILFGLMADRLGFARALRLNIAVMTIGAFIPVVTVNLWALGLSVVLAVGIMPACGSLAAGRSREIVAPEVQTVGWSVVTLAFAVMQAAGAYGASALLSITQSYPATLLAGAILLLAGLIADLIFTPRAKVG